MQAGELEVLVERHILVPHDQHFASINVGFKLVLCSREEHAVVTPKT